MLPRRCMKCRQLFTGPRCPRASCSSRAARGYGQAHQAARRQLAATLPTRCGYCGEMVRPGSRWHAAHVVDGDPTSGWIVTHAACNLRAQQH